MALLAYLAVSGQEHSRDKLATLLWPENDQRSARTELSRTLSVLNRTLGKGWLAANRETASLNKPDGQPHGLTFWLDVEEFQGKLKFCEAHNHLPTVTCPTCLPSLEAAVELYSDEFMAGFSLKDCMAYDEWQFFQWEELRTKLTNALVRLSSHYANALAYEAAIRHTRRWLSLDPLHEPAHRQMISLFSKSGQQAAALRQYENCRQLLADELGVQPSEETKELYQRIRASRQVTAAAFRSSSNLPVQSTPFIGRESELAEIQAKLKQDECRLLTLLGPGGSGKTRLAIEAAGQLLDDFKHGVLFVNLAPLQEPDRIVSTIATVLRFSFYEEGTPEAQLMDYLRNKGMLLILDNFEHLLAGARFVNQIINIAPDIKILATSRTSLAVTSEHIYPVMGMAYPESPEPLKTVSEHYSAVRLFESTAKRRQPAFEMTDDNLSDVIQVCALLEGMPLGIVMAASWVRMLSPAEIAEEIARDLAFLETDMQDLPRRQRSLRSVFNHSWQLLSDGQRDTMRALSVFRGGFTRDSAQRVAGASMLDLMGLTDQSMLYRTACGRYEIHELLRQYAAKQLEMVPHIENQILDKHSDFFCQALADWQNDLEGPRQGKALKEMTEEINNIQAAWERAVEQVKIRKLFPAILSLCYYYLLHLQYLEGEKTCRLVLDKLTEIDSSTQDGMHSLRGSNVARHEILELQAMAMSWQGFFSYYGLGEVEFARELIQKSLTLLEKFELNSQNARFVKAEALKCLSLIIRSKSRDEANQLLEESLELFRSLDRNYSVGVVLENLGIIAPSADDRVGFFEESLAVRRKQGDLWGIVLSLLYLSAEAAGTCEFKQAERMLNEALTICKDISYRHGIVISQRYLSFVYLLQGNFQLARVVLGETLSLYSDLESTPAWALAFAIVGYADLYMGDYDMAFRQAQDSLTLCSGKRHLLYVTGTTHARSILGKIALAKGSYVEAGQWFQESISLFQKWFTDLTAVEQDNIGRALTCLGYVARGLNQISQAQGNFYQVLSVAIEEERYLSLIQTLPGIALLFADQGEAERAVELYALAATQGIVANSKWFDDIAGDEIAAIAEELPAEVVEATKARGRALDLWEAAAELLDELEELGWTHADP
jgi:predicted ATPase/DNA-binding SARP family transcriptional activator